jgi:fibronectin type 3 domain-containing protein
VILFIVLGGCGYVGDPLPPALNIPTPINDFRALEYGDNFLVEFTPPHLTTDGLPLRNPKAVELWIGESKSPFTPESWAAGAKKYELTGDTREVPTKEWIGKDITMAVRVLGPKGRPSGWSNFVVMNAGAPLEAPRELKVENVAPGVALSWKGSGPHYRIFRAIGDGIPERFAETDQPQYTDDTTQYGMRYRYLVQAIAQETRQSLAAESQPITPEDKFPPAVPGALTAVAGVNTIELVWTRNAEPDFKGYNVYRGEGTAALQKIASLLEVPNFTDSKVEAGKRYRYAITAVDLLGNESAQSNTAEALAQ